MNDVISFFDDIVVYAYLQSSLEISRQIISKHGIPGFWRGTVASLARQMPGIAMFYGIVEYSSPKTPSQRLITGMAARSIATTIFLPLVVIKTKIEFGSQPNMAKSANFIYKTEGMRGFWKGLIPTLARDGPYSGIYLVLYRLMQEKTGKYQMNENLGYKILFRKLKSGCFKFLYCICSWRNGNNSHSASRCLALSFANRS